MAESKAKRYYTRNVLFQFIAALVVVSLIAIWKLDFFESIYLKNQLSDVGITINGGIALLFLAGLIRVITMLVRYMSEEAAINHFVENIRAGEDPLQEVDETTLVVHRYETLKLLHRKRANINHSALAATLLATESAHNSFPKFVHNTLILTGVFGTIVSLSIALLGANDLIQDPTQTDSLGSVIHGMSTALSTTMTAILAYLFFGYFYIKLTDVQTYLIARIEEVTATILLPHLQLSQDAIIKEYTDTVHAATQLVHRFDESQQQYNEAAQSLVNVLQRMELVVQRDETHMNTLNKTLLEITHNQTHLIQDNQRLLKEVSQMIQSQNKSPNKAGSAK